MKERKALACLAAGALTAAAGAVWYLENNDLETTQLFYQDDKLPAAFDGFRIAQVADLHDKQFGTGQERLLSALRAVKPDCIVMTGDLIDRRRRGGRSAAVFIRGAARIAPVYFVTGNHENWSGKEEEVKRFLAQEKVTVLDDRCETLTRGNESITLAGVSDETCQPAESRRDGQEALLPALGRLLGGAGELYDPLGASPGAHRYICTGGRGSRFLRACARRPVPPARHWRAVCAGAGCFPEVYGRAVYHGGDDNDCQPRLGQQPVSPEAS